MSNDTTSALLTRAKTALRITTTAYDTEITGLIESAQLDLGIAGVEYAQVDELVTTAIVTYVKARFGSPSNYNALKAAYDEQKAQLMNATGYTSWGGGNA